MNSSAAQGICDDATLSVRSGRYEAALATIRQLTHDASFATLESIDPRLAYRALMIEANCESRRDRPSAALEQALRRAVQVADVRLTTLPRARLVAHEKLASLLRLTSRSKEALPHARAAFDLSAELRQPRTLQEFQRTALIEALIESGEPAEAERHLLEARDYFATDSVGFVQELLGCHDRLGRCYVLMNRGPEAVRAIDDGLAIATQRFGNGAAITKALLRLRESAGLNW